MRAYKLQAGTKVILTPEQERKAKHFCYANKYDMQDYLASVVTDNPFPARLTIEGVLWTAFWLALFLAIGWFFV